MITNYNIELDKKNHNIILRGFNKLELEMFVKENFSHIPEIIKVNSIIEELPHNQFQIPGYLIFLLSDKEFTKFANKFQENNEIINFFKEQRVNLLKFKFHQTSKGPWHSDEDELHTPNADTTKMIIYGITKFLTEEQLKQISRMAPVPNLTQEQMDKLLAFDKKMLEREKPKFKSFNINPNVSLNLKASTSPWDYKK